MSESGALSVKEKRGEQQNKTRSMSDYIYNIYVTDESCNFVVEDCFALLS